MATSWSYFHGATDEIEKYTVSLVLKGSEEYVFLAAFRGEGAIQTGWSGVLFGDDDLVDYSGDQEGAARGFVGTLQRVLDVPLGKQLYHAADATGTHYRCSECGRNSPPNKSKCQYCGKPVITV